MDSYSFRRKMRALRQAKSFLRQLPKDVQFERELQEHLNVVCSGPREALPPKRCVLPHSVHSWQHQFHFRPSQCAAHTDSRGEVPAFEEVVFLDADSRGEVFDFEEAVWLDAPEEQMIDVAVFI